MGYKWRMVLSSLSLSQHTAQITSAKLSDTSALLTQVQAELDQLKSTNFVAQNIKLANEISTIDSLLTKAKSTYEDILRLRDLGVKTQSLDALFTQALVSLSLHQYASSSAQLRQLAKAISDQQAALTTGVATIPQNVTQTNTPPTNGYRQQRVNADVGSFVVDIIAGDLNSARVIVETASPSDCFNNCPVDDLSDFVTRGRGFAGVNGPYFCPAEYPSCAGKTNSFDTLLMNANKVYFNSANNVYSIVPAVIFSGSSARFVAHSEDWGRDTSVDSVIAGQPLLLLGGTIEFGGDSDPKKNVRTTRAFIATINQTVYIGMVHGASVVEVAHVLKTMGIQNAINLDDAGSAALYFSGHYLVGPGRNTPFGIVLVRK